MRHQAEFPAKGFTCWGQFVAMRFCQVAHCSSLREVCLRLAGCESPLKHLGASTAAKESTPGTLRVGLHALAVRARLRQANRDAGAARVEEVRGIVAQLRARWPGTKIVLRADSGFWREEPIGWCELNGVDYVFGLVRNKRLAKIIGARMQLARVLHRSTGNAARVFTEVSYRTHKSWSRPRRVVAKAEVLDKGENPRFVVTSLTAEQWAAQELYEKFDCARGEMENRIKERMCLFAGRLSTDEMKSNQLRLYFSAVAYTPMGALRRLGLKGAAQVDTIRLKLFKIGAIARISVRRIVLQMRSPYPWSDLYAAVFDALRC